VAVLAFTEGSGSLLAMSDVVVEGLDSVVVISVAVPSLFNFQFCMPF
jgi:hypothetical protein